MARKNNDPFSPLLHINSITMTSPIDQEFNNIVVNANIPQHIRDSYPAHTIVSNGTGQVFITENLETVGHEDDIKIMLPTAQEENVPLLINTESGQNLLWAVLLAKHEHNNLTPLKTEEQSATPPSPITTEDLSPGYPYWDFTGDDEEGDILTGHYP